MVEECCKFVDQAPDDSTKLFSMSGKKFASSCSSYK